VKDNVRENPINNNRGHQCKERQCVLSLTGSKKWSWKEKNASSGIISINFSATEISNHDHLITDPAFILIQLWQAHAKWCACKKKSANLHHQFLVKRANFFASKKRGCPKRRQLKPSSKQKHPAEYTQKSGAS
jgi:hypothetical protein